MRLALIHWEHTGFTWSHCSSKSVQAARQSDSTTKKISGADKLVGSRTYSDLPRAAFSAALARFTAVDHTDSINLVSRSGNRCSDAERMRSRRISSNLQGLFCSSQNQGGPESSEQPKPIVEGPPVQHEAEPWRPYEYGWIQH